MAASIHCTAKQTRFRVESAPRGEVGPGTSRCPRRRPVLQPKPLSWVLAPGRCQVGLTKRPCLSGHSSTSTGSPSASPLSTARQPAPHPRPGQRHGPATASRSSPMPSCSSRPVDDMPSLVETAAASRVRVLSSRRLLFSLPNFTTAPPPCRPISRLTPDPTSSSSALLRAMAEKLIPGMADDSKIAILQQTSQADSNASSGSIATDEASHQTASTSVLQVVIDRVTARDEVEQELKRTASLTSLSQ